MTLAAVETIYETNCRSIPAMLREAAASIEAETDDDQRTTAMVAVQLTDEGQVQVYGWGDTSDIHALGLLRMGEDEVIRMTKGDRAE